MDFTPAQISILQTLQAKGFEIVAFPKYASNVGIRKGNCVVLLTPIATAGFEILATAGYMLGENIAVRVKQGPREFFVWKNEKLEATPDRLAELAAFSDEVWTALLPRA
jgi:hypothetical protein